MALPKQVVLVPLVRIVNFMGIHDTLWAVILPLIGWPFGVFLMKQFSETSRQSCLNQLKFDGCGEIRTFWSVAFPIVKPGFAALAIFTFINTWNDYFMQLVMFDFTNNLTISLGGCNYAGRNGNQLWFDHGRSCPCSCANRNSLPCLPKNLSLRVLLWELLKDNTLRKLNIVQFVYQYAEV